MQFESLFMHIGDGVLVGHPDGAILRANPAACRALGRSEAELQRLTRADLIVETSEVADALPARSQGETVKVEMVFRRADGRTFPAEVTTALIPNDPEQLTYAIFRDISERRSAEAELRASEQRFRTFFEGLQEAVSLVSPTPHDDGVTRWKIIEANAAADRLGGGRGLRGSWLHDVLGADAADREHVFAQVLETGVPVSYESSFAEHRYIVHAYRHSEQIVGVSMLDVTEQRRAEEAQRVSRELADERAIELSTLLDAVPAAVWIARDPQGDRIDTNRFGADLLRTSHGANASITSPDDDRPRHFKAKRGGVELTPDELPIQAAAKFGEPQRNVELDLHFDDGTVRNLLGSAVPLHGADGTVRGSVGAFVDITERAIAERTLADALARFNAFMSTTPAIAWVKDAEGRIVYVNTAWQRAFGLSEADAIGRRENELRPEELASGLDDIDRRVLAIGEPVTAREAHFPLPGDELPRWWRTTRFRFGLQDGTPSLGCVAVDVTTQVRTEDALRASERLAREAQHDLEQALETTRRTEEKFRQAQKMEAVGRLAGGVAHDFNNILTAILGNGEFLLQQLRNDPLAADVEEILNAGRRAAALTRQLLAFSRKQVLEPRVLNLNSVVSSMHSMLARLLGEDVDLRLLLHPHPHMCFVDPGQMEQVLLNLAVNARDAMPNGGRLTIETMNVVLDQDYVQHHPEASPGPHLLLTVSDSGHGMSREIQSHLFEPFFTTKPQGKGTGLGLSTVYGIVKQSGGTIWVYSEPGQGTTFKVYLPQATAAEEAPPPVRVPSSQFHGTETILLAEDDPQVRNVVSAILRRAGYHVIESTNGGEALLICEQHGGTIQLLLTDVVMPKMNGRQLADRLRVIRPALKVLFMSGYTENVVVHHGVVDSGIEFLQKPITAETLLPKVREVLDRKVPGV